jgi:hypothetical protein
VCSPNKVGLVSRCDSIPIFKRNAALAPVHKQVLLCPSWLLPIKVLGLNPQPSTQILRPHTRGQVVGGAFSCIVYSLSSPLFLVPEAGTCK